MKTRCIILGGGGHARVLIDCIQTGKLARIHGILVPDEARWGQRLMDVPILGGDDLVTQMVARGVTAFVVGLGSIGHSEQRRRLYEFGLANGLQPLTVVHPAAVCSKWASIGSGVQLLPGCIVNAGAQIGRNVIVNSSAVVEHDCMIGDHVHLATGVRLSGNVHIQMGAHVGAGAVVRQGIIVGQEAVVGAGAVVVKDVPSGVVVVGVPAHILRPVEN